MTVEKDETLSLAAAFRGQTAQVQEYLSQVRALTAALEAAQVTIRVLVGQPRPDDDPRRLVWDAEQRAILLRRQVEELQAEVERLTRTGVEP